MKTFETVLRKLVEAGWRTSTMADELLQQYMGFHPSYMENNTKKSFKSPKTELTLFFKDTLMTTGIINLCGRYVSFVLLFLMVSLQ